MSAFRRSQLHKLGFWEVRRTFIPATGAPDAIYQAPGCQLQIIQALLGHLSGLTPSKGESVALLGVTAGKLQDVQTRFSSRSPAKLNLTLRVGPLRSDGFHDVESLVVPIDLCDEVTVEAAPAGAITITCSDRSIPTDDTNLAARAARHIAQYAEFPGGTRIHLEKKIPAGAGLGGGSSNAATVLKLLNQLWDLQLDHAALQEVAAQLGSDVPLFLAGGPSLVRGRGEIVTPMPLQVGGYAVLLLSDIHCATAEVYRRFDELGPPPPRISPIYFAPALRGASHLMQTAYNDLEPAAFRVAPDLGRLMLRATAQCSSPVRMSGSGSALYTLVDTMEQAQKTAQDWAGLAGRAQIASLLS